MCEYNSLVKEKYGYVLQCEECKTICITFGNFSLQQNESDYYQFLELIKFNYKKYQDFPHKNCRVIWIETRLDNLQLVLNFQELTRLMKMLSNALQVLEAEKLLEDL